MDKRTIAKKVKALRDLKALRDNLDHQVSELESVIKAEMIAQDKYEFSGEGWSVTWKLYETHRFNQSDFREDHPEIFELYNKATTSRRFSVS